MKYITPDLIQRGNSLDDDVADAAADEWERAIVRYQKRWDKTKSVFPKKVQRFEEDHICLHDAKVLVMTPLGNAFVMVMQMEPPSRDVVILEFTLTGEPIIDQEALPNRPATSQVYWMYQEFDLDRHQKWWFEVLLSNGWSVQLPFRDFRYLIGPRILPEENGQVARISKKTKVRQRA